MTTGILASQLSFQYNDIFMVDVEKDQEGLDKLVLDFDPKSKAELVSVHEKLAKSLKPHQVGGLIYLLKVFFYYYT